MKSYSTGDGTHQPLLNKLKALLPSDSGSQRYVNLPNHRSSNKELERFRKALYMYEIVHEDSPPSAKVEEMIDQIILLAAKEQKLIEE